MSNYPTSIDTEAVLHTVHDSLRLRLAQDYTPGDARIYVEGDITVFDKFPDSGYITLTEQCSDPELRAISFSYSGKEVISEVLYRFNNITLLSRFQDVEKPKKLTYVTQNVMAEYHNELKDAIVAIQDFVGVQGTIDPDPYGPTMEGRTNFLHKLVLQPKAWFTAERTFGLVPLTITFNNKSFQIGEGCPVEPVQYIWDFGDGDCSQISVLSHISIITSECPTISVESVIPVDAVDVRVLEHGTYPYSGSVVKTYSKPGKYDVSLTVINKWGQDQIVLPGFVVAKLPAPEEAIIDIIIREGQIKTSGDPPEGPYVKPPVVRSSVDTFIDFEIQDGVRPNSADTYAPFGRSFGGEILNSHRQPVDPIVDYNWQLSDDLSHGNAKSARASYSVGGLYDIILRVDTEFDAYRITRYQNAVDIVENVNLWHWTFKPFSNQVTVSEFGLISETFKTRPPLLTVSRNSSFLSEEANSEQLIREFNRNTFFCPMSSASSGQRGNALIYWASGRDSAAAASTETINMTQFNGFTDTYSVPYSPVLNRPWNWLGMKIYPYAFFLWGNSATPPAPGTSPTSQEKLTQNLGDNLAVTTPSFVAEDYLSGADELMENVCIYDSDGNPYQGHFSAYRGTTKGHTGFFVRNSGVGVFYRLRSFYKTEGILSDPIQKVRKLPDMLGTTKLEGQLVSLTSGLFFFDNSASLSAYNDTSGVWETGSAGADSASFASLQDRSVVGFSRFENTLLAASDGDRRAYLSYDYSENAFIQFNESSLSFRSLGVRPTGEQWLMATY